VLLYISLFATVLGYLFWNNGIKQLGAARTSLFFNLVPIFAALSSLLLGQHISLLQWVGMLVVLCGLLLPRLVRGLGQWRSAALAGVLVSNPNAPTQVGAGYCYWRVTGFPTPPCKK